MTEELNLDEFREEVKKVTIEMIKLAGKRMELVKRIGEIKRQRKLPLEDFKAEKELRQAVRETCKTFNINIRFGLKLLNLLISEAKKVQKREDTHYVGR